MVSLNNIVQMPEDLFFFWKKVSSFLFRYLYFGPQKKDRNLGFEGHELTLQGKKLQRAPRVEGEIFTRFVNK
jgi:hypothetical protein